MTKLDQLNNAVIVEEEFQAPTGVVEAPSFKFTSVHFLLMGLALLCLLFILFITLARSIQITTVTANITKPEQLLLQAAEVKLDSWLKLPLGNRVLVLPGSLGVTATAEGFSELQQTLEVGSGRHQQFELILVPLPGQLDITLSPGVAATLSIDGEQFADLPRLVEGVPAGQHEIIIDAPLYRSATRSIVVQGKGQTESLEVTLDPAWGELSLGSTPESARILIDGEEVGVTPLTLKVEEGTHTLQVQADKFKPYSQEFTIFAQQELQVPNIELIPADGILEVATRPAEAAVILNGEYRGLSPITLRVKPDQPQRLQLYRAGYRLQDEELSLAPAQRQLEQVQLQQDVAAVRFSVSPSDAVIYVDGVRRGTGSQTINLNTLPHRVSVRKPGYVSYENEIIPTKSSTQVVSARLLTRAEHFWANVPDSYNTAAGQQMKLFKSPGKVQLGSSRRETGRRSNETQYSAELTKHFYVSLNEITNKQFRAFMPSHNSGNYKRKSLDSAKHPVVNVSWQQAALYCNWLSKREKLTPFYQTKSGYVSGHNPDANGYRLLTEVEWAWLARNDGDKVLTYPWKDLGSLLSPQPLGNFADVSSVELIAFTLPEYNDGFVASAPVGKFPANHRGLFDINGNVAEWTNDWYSANSDYASNPPKLVDPLGPEEGEFHVIRGASWARGHLPQLRLAYRDFGAKGTHDVGFRIARYVGQPE
ncbi:MAG: PEGA domain-containing protein [Pseudomonadota bacterium]